MTITSVAIAMANARASAGLTQRELSSRAKTAQSLIARIERGHANPTIGTLERLLRAAGFELKIEAVPAPTPDPVLEVYKRDIDRSLLVENLKKTPDERVRTLVAMDRLFREAQRARATKRKRG
jgi:transcriptional regulator with XRE-family HTH domain